MHSFEGPNGTRFYVSAMASNIDIGTGGHTHAVNIDDLLAFAEHVRRERQEQHEPDAWTASIADFKARLVTDPDREKREFVRRAAIAIWAETQHMGDEFAAETAVIRAQKLWDALQEKGL